MYILSKISNLSLFLPTLLLYHSVIWFLNNLEPPYLTTVLNFSYECDSWFSKKDQNSKGIILSAPYGNKALPIGNGIPNLIHYLHSTRKLNGLLYLIITCLSNSNGRGKFQKQLSGKVFLQVWKDLWTEYHQTKPKHLEQNFQWTKKICGQKVWGVKISGAKMSRGRNV